MSSIFTTTLSSFLWITYFLLQDTVNSFGVHPIPYLNQWVPSYHAASGHYPLKFPGYIFVPVASQNSEGALNYLSSLKLINPLTNEGYNEEISDNFIDEFLQNRFLELIKDEIVSHYSKDQSGGNKASYLPFDVDALTSYDIKQGLLRHDYYHNEYNKACKLCKPGYPGHIGPRGIPGRRGVIGDKGNHGTSKGDQGDQGQEGPVGENGQNGEEGPKGAKGVAQEVPGAKGDKGTHGDMGPTGEQGEENRGPPGMTGDKGEAGSTGDAVNCCNVGIYDTTLHKCIVHVSSRLPYSGAVSYCQNHFYGTVSDPFNYSEIITLLGLLDSSGEHIWTSHSSTGVSGGTGSCVRYNFDDASLSLTHCAYIDDFVCQYSTTVPGCP